ncbi:MAG: Nudix family hydrolase [Burkholderiaceae bacterium]
MSAMRTPVDVAAGVLIRSDGRFLLASRPEGKPYASYWEFPGGKVEAGESIAAALARELHEELSIDIGAAHRWVARVFDYPHALVRLHFCRVFAWRGQLHAREGQQYGFFSPDVLPAGPLLPATIPVLKWLKLPSTYAISAVAKLGRKTFMQRLESALERGLKLLQFREPMLDAADAAASFREARTLVHAAGATVLVNSRHGQALCDQADGVHLTAADLARTQQRPEAEWVAASTHTRSGIERAAQIGADFIVAGPVKPTETHTDRCPLGWSAFAELIADTAIPAYALGGLQSTDLPTAIRCGAHGVAALSAVWSNDQWFDFDAPVDSSASALVSDPATE